MIVASPSYEHGVRCHLGHPQTSDIWRQGIMPQTKRLQLWTNWTAFRASNWKASGLRKNNVRCKV